MTSALTPQRRAFLRRLERADAGGDSRVARDALIADGQVVQPRARARNAAVNSKLAAIGRLPDMFLAPTVHINTKPTPNGAKAVARAKQRKGPR
jgi:hypothetical protein